MTRPEFTPRFLETATEIRERMLGNMSDEYRKEKGDFMYDTIDANPSEIIGLQLNQDRILRNSFPQYCEDEYMDLFLQIRGLERIQSTYSVRTLSIEADPGVRIPKGYTFTSVVLDTDGNPIEFKANIETIFPVDSTVQEIRITCNLTGEVGNLATGSEFILQPPIPGIRSIIDTGVIIPGAEKETLDAAWAKYLEKVANPDTGGNRNDYRRWILNDFFRVTNVAIGKIIVEMCWDKSNGQDGRGTVRIICAGSDYKPLSKEVIGMLQEYLDPIPYQGYGYGKAPMGAFVTVITGVTRAIDVSATVSYSLNADPADVLARFKKDLTEYIQGRVFEIDPATEDLYPIAYNKVGAILGNTIGVENYGSLTVNGGTSDIELHYFDIPEMGAVVLT